MARKWVSGLKNGQTYYLNLETNEETFIKPRNFDEEQAEGRSLAAAAAAAAAPADQQECTDQAASNAKAQLDSGVITQEEYDIIMAKIQAGQEVDDIDQFLNDTPSAKKHAKESLPAELTSDPDLVITDLTTGKKVRAVVVTRGWRCRHCCCCGWWWWRWWCCHRCRFVAARQRLCLFPSTSGRSVLQLPAFMRPGSHCGRQR